MKLQRAFSATRWVWLAAMLLALLAVALVFFPSPTSAQSASLTATVNNDRSVDLDLSNGPADWWFRINSWGTCTAVSGTSVNGIQGYKPGTHSVTAYSDNDCDTQLAETSFTIPAASLAATVNSDRSVDLTLSNGPSPWYFRIDGGSCTTVNGTTVSGIKGYAPGYYSAGAFATAGCKDFLAVAGFTIPDPPPPTATLTTTVNPGPSVNLTLSNGPSNNNWWFRINWWGSCTAVTGTNTVNNIQGYKVGTHSVDAYSDSGCDTKIASSSFIIPDLALTITVNDDRSVDLTLAGGPTDWWFRIKLSGHCTAATGTTVSGIRGYPSGSYLVAVYPDSDCEFGEHITGESFTIPTATLAATVIGNETVDLTLTNGPANWWFRINWWGGCTAATGNAVYGIAGYQPGTHHVTAYSDSGCKYPMASAPFTIHAPALTAEGVSAAGATLVIAYHNAQWWYQADKAPHDSCQGPVAAGTAGQTLTGLSPLTAYAYTAYSDSGCSTALTPTTSFTTPGVSVSNLDETESDIRSVGRPSTTTWGIAGAFTTGTNSGGYLLGSVTVRVGSTTILTSATLNMAIHADSGGNPAAQATHTLAGTSPTAGGDVSYNCSGSCNLSASTTYHLVLTATTADPGNFYYIRLTSSDSETNTPAGAGWSIANGTKQRQDNGNWSDHTPIGGGDDAVMFMVAAAEVPTPPSLTASGITGTGATLTIADHTGAWHYQRIQPADTTCNTVASGATATLASLTANTLYGYTAYSDSACTTALDTVYFSTTDFDVGNLAEAASTSQCSFGYATASNNQCAVAFTTGAFPGGYQLNSIAGQFGAKSGAPASVSVAIHEADTTNSSNPAATAIANATFSGNDPDTAGLHSYTCAGSGCDLSPSTTYFVVMSTSDTSAGNQYHWTLTDSDAETVHPASNGWAIANAGRAKLGSAAWASFSGTDANRSPMLHIAADKNPVSVSSLGQTRNGSRAVGKLAGNHKKNTVQFTTGGNAGGYDLLSVTFEIDIYDPVYGTPGDLVVAIYSNGSNNRPDTSVTTLTGSNPTGAGQHTYSCSSNCALASSTKYHVYLDAPNATGTSNYYAWQATGSSSETLAPSSNGWSLEESYQHSSGTGLWNDLPDYLKVKVTAMPK